MCNKIKHQASLQYWTRSVMFNQTTEDTTVYVLLDIGRIYIAVCTRFNIIHIGWLFSRSHVRTMPVQSSLTGFLARHLTYKLLYATSPLNQEIVEMVPLQKPPPFTVHVWCGIYTVFGYIWGMQYIIFVHVI